MDKKQLMNVLVPAVAAAAVVVLVGLLIVSGDGGTPTAASGKGNAPASAKQVASGEMNDSGMTGTLPPPDAAEWKPGPGEMKVWDVKEGEGDPCLPGASVTIHYTGWTLDGNSFDSSRKRGDPTTFSLGSLIKGWQEGIPGMKPGGVRRLKIPGDWAYGPGGQPSAGIPPNATLIFEVKLLGWK